MRYILSLALTAAFIALLVNMSSIGCSNNNCSEVKWGYEGTDLSHYDNVQAKYTTSQGTPYDTSGLDISPLLIDRLVSEVETCLHTQFPDSTIDSETYDLGYCSSSSFSYPIDRTSFEVKIASDWILSCEKDNQLLNVLAPQEGCTAKGYVPDPNCPCRWRSVVLCDGKIITTPSFYLFKDALTRYITNCAAPWSSAKLTQCVSPSTTPLSDGSDPNNGLDAGMD